ncbi:MAG: hypothetical protein KDD67_18010 [Ignavibacteriae bacterium]|nr:hypothetical protein [Ignavibacteriota bacterium]MCB9214591.1 hypothetical protein [Ignavibacteria bacterium]
MKLIYLLTTTLLFVTSSSLFSQTKLIGHRSHSGSGETFTLAAEGNFGWDPSWNIPIDTTEQTDSVENGASGTTTIDTLTIEEPRIDSLQPNVSNRDQAYQMNTDRTTNSSNRGDHQNRLLWLALGLGFPVVIAVGRTLLRRSNDKEA